MNIAFMLFIVSIMIIIFFGESIQETFIETFIPVDEPKQFLENCKVLTRDSSNVQSLLNLDGCKQDPLLDISMGNRDAINKKMYCKDLVSKEIVLGLDSSSWCNRVSQVDREQIVNAPTTIMLEGPQFMEEQNKLYFNEK